MKKIHLIFALLFTASAAIAISWTPNSASVKFYIKNTGVTVDGTLSGLKATVSFDPNDLANSKIYASVNVNTIKTGIQKRDNHLLQPEYFNAAKHPKIVMTSTAFSSKGGNNYNGTFNVSIKGKTKSVKVPFTFTETNGKGKFAGSFKVDRLDYGVGESSWMLGDDVTVKISLTSTKKD
ncbi:MAG: YceI family protein [Bacteroidia bacterium]|nr:YceI family protein [Bacteroidia bacterium]